MTSREKLLLTMHRESIWAEHVLRERGYDLTAQGVYDMMLLATGDEEQAEEAWLKRVEDDLRNDRNPE